jgi:hypothetical protein
MPLLSNKDRKHLTVLFQVNATDIPTVTVRAKAIVLKAALR